MKRLFLIFLICFVRESSADELSLAQLSDIIIAHHPALSATEEEIKGARAELLSSQGSFDPVLKGEFNSYTEGDYSGTYANIFAEQPLEFYGSKIITGYRRGSGSFPVYDDYNYTNHSGEIRAGVEVPLLRDGVIDRRRASIAKALLQVNIADLSLAQRKIEIIRASSFAYWDWVLAHKRHSIFRDLLKVAEERDRQLSQRVKSGDLAQFDQDDNQRQVLQRQSQLISAERNLRKAEFDLSLFIWNEDGSSNGKILFDPPKIFKEPIIIANNNIKFVIEEAQSNRPEVQRFNKLIEQQDVENNLAQNQIQPRIDFQIYASKDYGDGSSSRDESEIKTGVRLEVPLETRTQRGRIDAVDAKTREIKLQKKLTEQRIEIDINDAHNAMILSHERLLNIRKEVKLTEALENGEIDKFLHGESNLIFVNLREQSTADVKAREAEAIADTWKAKAQYQAALGIFQIQ